MTPKMLRPIAWIAGAITLVLGLIWLLQEAGTVAWIDNPLPAIVVSALVTFVAYHLANKGRGKQE